MLDKEYELYHFSETVKEKNVDFDYKLKWWKLKNRNAIRILKINDYLDDLINEAIEISEKLDNITVTKRPH
jgi:DNA mismatch repair ATPase MutS